MIPSNSPIFIRISIQRKPTPPFQPKTSQPPHVHNTVELQILRAQRFRQEISMLPCRPHVRNGDRSVRNQLPQEVIACINVLRIRIGDGVLRELPSTFVILEHRHTRCLHSRQHKTPNLLQKEHSLHCLRHCDVLCFCNGKRNTLLSSRKPAHTSTPTHCHSSRDRSPISCLARVVCIGKHRHQQPIHQLL